MDYKMTLLRQLKNLHFPMGKDSQDFGQKLENSFEFVSVSYLGLDIMVDGILDKEVFLDYNIVTMRQSKYWHFSKGLTYECG